MAPNSTPIRRALAAFSIRGLARTGLVAVAGGPRAVNARCCFVGDPATAVAVFITVCPDGLSVRDCFVTGASSSRSPDSVFRSIGIIPLLSSSDSCPSPSISSATRLPVGVLRGWPGGIICRTGVVGIGVSSAGGVTGRATEAAAVTASASRSRLVWSNAAQRTQSICR